MATLLSNCTAIFFQSSGKFSRHRIKKCHLEQSGLAQDDISYLQSETAFPVTESIIFQSSEKDPLSMPAAQGYPLH